MLPPKRDRPRSGIERAAKKEFPRHRRFLRSHHCVVRGCPMLPIEVSHIRYGAHAGMGQKPHDSLAVPMCGGPEGHHAEYHRIGHDTFERKYGLNLRALAAEFTRASTDQAMKESLREAAE